MPERLDWITVATSARSATVSLPWASRDELLA
jgi:hypothetical protein